MKISVIVPIFNCESFLAICLNSILSQTYKNIDVIVIDDGSTDQSSSIARDYARKDSRITLFTQKNKGVSAARNKGIDLATGDYVLFVDADDYIAINTAVEQLVSYIAIANNPDVIQFKRVGDSQNRFTKLPVSITDSVLGEMIVSESLNTLWNKMYNLTLIKKHRIHFPDGIRMGEDLLFNAHYFNKIQTIAHLNQELYFYREDNQSSATKRYMHNKYGDLTYVNKELAKLFKNRSSPVINSLEYIRLKNALSCIRDLNNKSCNFSKKEKVLLARKYKHENNRFVITHYGIKRFAISVVYSSLSGTAIFKIMSVMR